MIWKRFILLLTYSLIYISVSIGLPLRTSGQSFQLMRYDEDYSYLKDSSRTFYNQLKYSPLSKNQSSYISIGGEVRYEYAAFDNEDWGRFNIGHNNFLLQRYDLHADIHIKKRIRFFGQLRSALENGRKNGPRPIDEDKLNVQNLFVDIIAYKKNAQELTLRLGRQELNYGSGRLISVRDGPNVRLYFTGAKAMYSSKNLVLDGFVMMADTTRPGIFDNKATRQANLWGIYSTLNVHKAGSADFYYLGTYRDSTAYEEGTATEIRHTVGSRLFKNGAGFIYNLEAAYQFGKFGTGKISAWTGSADVGYSFDKVKFQPSVNLRNDYISGDRRAGDNSLQTFNPLYPQGGYFGFDPQIGPVNLIDIHPYATVTITNQLSFQIDAVFNWRYSLQDGIYRPSGAFYLPGAGSDKMYIGTGWLASGRYDLNKFISLNLGAQYFQTGSFIDSVIPNAKNGLFINARIGFKF